MKNRITLVMFGAWVVLLVVVGYWRICYAWQMGNFFKFMFHDIPLLILALIMFLSVDWFLFRISRQPHCPASARRKHFKDEA